MQAPSGGKTQPTCHRQRVSFDYRPGCVYSQFFATRRNILLSANGNNQRYDEWSNHLLHHKWGDTHDQFGDL